MSPSFTIPHIRPLLQEVMNGTDRRLKESPYIRRMMNRRTNTLLRQKASLIPMFDGIGDGILDRLFQISKIVKFNEEDVVLKAGKTVEDI